MWRKGIRLLLWIAVGCAVLCAAVYAFLDPWTVPGDDQQLNVSIEPTLSVGDILLVSRSRGASVGALVRCVDPDSPGRFVVGRVVAQGNDAVEFTKGTLLVNGKAGPSSVACDPAIVRLKNPGTQEEEELTCILEDLGGGLHPMLRSPTKPDIRDLKIDVEPGKVYLASDNRVMHLDSRDFAAVQPSTCQRIVYRLWGTSGWLDTKKRLTLLW